VLSCRKFAPRTGQMLPDFSTEIKQAIANQRNISEAQRCGLLLAKLWD
jgi:hypothetical protein